MIPAKGYPTALAHPEIHAFLGRFRRRHTYGSSMGGFTALAFADLLGTDNVVAMQPVSSLRADLVPWEARFRPGAALDWTGDHADALGGISTPQQVWTLFDPDDLEAPHARRIAEAAGTRHRPVHVPKAGHAVPRTLQAAGLLGRTLLYCLRQTDPEPLRVLIARAAAP